MNAEEVQEDKEGPFLITFTVQDDPSHRIKWGWLDKEEIRRSIYDLDEEDLERVGLLVALSFEFARPEISLCREFIESYDKVSHSGKIRGHTVVLDEVLIREAFVLPAGNTPRPGLVHHSTVADWFPHRDYIGKRYYARDCQYAEWRPALQMLNCVLLARRRPRAVHGLLALYVKSKVEGWDEDYDWANLMIESVEQEIIAIQKHIIQSKASKAIRASRGYYETFVGIFLTHLILHVGILDENEVIHELPMELQASPGQPGGRGERIPTRISTWREEEYEAVSSMADGHQSSSAIAKNAEFSLRSYGETLKIKYFLVAFVDLLGVLRSKLVPIAAIEKIQKEGAGFAGYAAHLDMTTADADLFAYPDPSCIIHLPWQKEVAWVASDLYMNGELVKQAPRQVLKNQIMKAKEIGCRMKTGVECEFYLLKCKNSTGVSIEEEMVTVPKPCYNQGALMRRFDLISELMEYMRVLRWKPYQADHEDGQGQFEINWEYDDCLATADKHVFFKFMVKSVAEKHGFRATFMPKPMRNQTGSGCHCHVSLWNEDGTVNVFHNDNGELGMSDIAYSFLGGVLWNAKALCSIWNPTVNSYKRIDGQTTSSGSAWAPITVSYAGNNRTHMVRIPDEGRFEIRLPDGSANPYLLQAGLLASGLHGINKGLDPGRRCDWDGFKDPPAGEKLDTLPTNLLDALRELSASESLKEALGDEFVGGYLKLQMQQWKLYTGHISQYELDSTFDC